MSQRTLSADDCPLDARSAGQSSVLTPDCPFHKRKLARTSPWYYHYGSFASLARERPALPAANTAVRPHQPRRFPSLLDPSSQTFATSTTDSIPAPHRQIAQPSGFPTRSSRTAPSGSPELPQSLRHLTRQLPLEEDIAFDGIGSYLRSQYIPDNFNIAVGCTSQVPYAFTLSFFVDDG